MRQALIRNHDPVELPFSFSRPGFDALLAWGRGATRQRDHPAARPDRIFHRI
jgi:hypothetical protein